MSVPRQLRGVARHQQAAALILAIMISVLVATIATAMMVSQHLSIFETSLINHNGKMVAVSAGITDLAQQRLLLVAAQHKRKILTYNAALPAENLAGVRLNATLQDITGRFNVNCLTETSNIPLFARLIQAVSSNYDKKSAMAVALQVSAWVRPNTNKSVNYQGQASYQIAHRPMAEISELRLVSGVTAGLMRRLAPYVIALPPAAKINLNAVSAPVLYALMPQKNVTMDKVNAIIACRNQAKGFKTAQDLSKCMAAQSLDTQGLKQRLMQMNSSYFMLKTLVRYQQQHLLVSSLIYIGTDLPVWQSSEADLNQAGQKNIRNARQANNTALRPNLPNGAKQPQKPLKSFVLWQSL